MEHLIKVIYETINFKITCRLIFDFNKGKIVSIKKVKSYSYKDKDDEDNKDK